MHAYFCKRNFVSLTPVRFFTALILWIVGLGFGITLASLADSALSFSGFSFVTYPASPFCFLLVSFMPYFACVLALRLNRFFLIYPLFFVFAFSQAFSSMFLFYYIGNGAWVIRLLFLFSSGVSSVLMWWLTFRYCFTKKSSFSKDVFLTSNILLLACILDLMVVSPFVTNFLHYF